MKAVINEASRVGLRIKSKPVQQAPFRVEPHSFGFKPGIDLDRMNQLADELEAELAIEHQAELYSNDADFRRFAGLRWVDPLR